MQWKVLTEARDGSIERWLATGWRPAYSTARRSERIRMQRQALILSHRTNYAQNCCCPLQSCSADEHRPRHMRPQEVSDRNTRTSDTTALALDWVRYLTLHHIMRSFKILINCKIFKIRYACIDGFVITLYVHDRIKPISNAECSEQSVQNHAYVDWNAV